MPKLTTTSKWYLKTKPNFLSVDNILTKGFFLPYFGETFSHLAQTLLDLRVMKTENEIFLLTVRQTKLDFGKMLLQRGEMQLQKGNSLLTSGDDLLQTSSRTYSNTILAKNIFFLFIAGTMIVSSSICFPALGNKEIRSLILLSFLVSD